MPFQLQVVRGRSSVNYHRLGPGVTVAGRQEGCQLQIKSSQVSRRHCELFEKDGRLIVKDLKSSNGTWVNGSRIDGQHVLNPGDELTIGGVKFRVAQAGSAAPAPGDTAVPAAAPAPVAVAVDDESIPLDDEATVLETSSNPAVPVSNASGASESDEEVAVSEINEDAVAEFLMDLDVDDDDKR